MFGFTLQEIQTLQPGPLPTKPGLNSAERAEADDSRRGVLSSSVGGLHFSHVDIE